MRKEDKKFDFTITEGFEMVISKLQMLEDTQTEIDFILDRIDKQKAKATSTKKEKKENTDILNIVLDILNGQELTLSNMLKDNRLAKYTYVEKSETKNVTTSKLNAIIQKELYSGKNESGEKIENVNARIIRVENGNKITFKLK